ncbi:MAG TPA: peroxiredoxin [Bacteroidota bacterium]|nr:peroxiredoxin [Bacteroidota bacterium]
MAVQVGSKAPSFTLVDTDKKPRSLSEFQGKKLVLAFFPGAFTGVCTKEMCALRDSMSRLNELDAQVVGISVDSPFANKGFAEKNNLQFPLLSDYTRTAVKAYGVELPNFAGLEGYTVAQRSVFVLDKDGIVRYAWVAENPGIEPNYEELTKAVSSI